MTATGAILAGGASRRMGRDKLRLLLGGVPLIVRVLDALGPRCDEMLVVGAADDVPLPPEVSRVPDVRPGRTGPLAGMEAALMAARHRAVFVAAGDMPFLSDGLVEMLLRMLAGRRVCAAVPRFGGNVHPLCAAYDRGAVLPVVSAALDRDERAVRGVLEGLSGVKYVGEEELRAVGEPELLLMNVNSPGDLERARAATGEHGAGRR